MDKRRVLKTASNILFFGAGTGASVYYGEQVLTEQEQKHLNVVCKLHEENSKLLNSQ